MEQTEDKVDIDIEDISVDTNSQEDILDEFYKKKFYFSYSSLKKLIYYPPAFYKHYILNEKEEKISKNLINGKLIHCLILQPDELNEQFLISPDKTPDGNNLLVVKRVFDYHNSIEGSPSLGLVDYSSTILDILVEIWLHQSLVDDKKDKSITGDSKRLDKMLTDENCSYFEFLKVAGTKTVIDQTTLDYCKKSAEIIRNDENVRKIMGMDAVTDSENEVFNETLLFADLDKVTFGLKGILDNYHIDHKNKIIYVNDLKTTGKTLDECEDTINFYDYDIQAVIYLSLIYYKYRDLGYTIEFRFVFIDKLLQHCIIKIKESTMNKWFEKYDDYIKKANYHYTEKRYNLPYKYDKGEITL